MFQTTKVESWIDSTFARGEAHHVNTFIQRPSCSVIDQASSVPAHDRCEQCDVLSTGASLSERERE